MSPVRLLRTIGGPVPGKRRRPPNQIADRVLDPLPRDVASASSGRDAPAPRYVIHLPATSADLAGAVDLAYALARSLGFLSQIEAGEATVCAEDAPHVRHRVCCDLLVPGGRRCALRAGHDGRCAEESPD
ncbi:hypothetical protein ACQEVC_33220 [Plantactinospora sp. CA-294935]|uniref:hypothetical protein n=1 Tax=Plantactinospora sp. CA-294935 TaxID=3240012 RepID=UPI003D8CE7A1